jgi:hypothetical protein
VYNVPSQMLLPGHWKQALLGHSAGQPNARKAERGVRAPPFL